MATATKTAKGGKAKAADRCGLVLEINGTSYRVRRLDVRAFGAARGYRLRKADGTAYDLCQTVDGATTCDCADATYRDHACKHARALAAWGLLKRLPTA